MPWNRPRELRTFVSHWDDSAIVEHNNIQVLLTERNPDDEFSSPHSFRRSPQLQFGDYSVECFQEDRKSFQIETSALV
jgi:hypothetical protein